MFCVINVTTEKAVANQVASAEIEGIAVSQEVLELVKNYTDSKLSHEELIKKASQLCQRA